MVENGDEGITTIMIKKSTKERIDNICTRKMTYDQIINFLLDEHEKCTNDGK